MLSYEYESIADFISKQVKTANLAIEEEARIVSTIVDAALSHLHILSMISVVVPLQRSDF